MPTECAKQTEQQKPKAAWKVKRGKKKKAEVAVEIRQFNYQNFEWYVQKDSVWD